MDRDTSKYVLKQGNKIVYVGITDNPERREAEHNQDKTFDKMEIVGKKSSRKSTEQWETERIQTYMKNHEGKTPKYNQNTSGK